MKVWRRMETVDRAGCRQEAAAEHRKRGAHEWRRKRCRFADSAFGFFSTFRRPFRNRKNPTLYIYGTGNVPGSKDDDAKKKRTPNDDA